MFFARGAEDEHSEAHWFVESLFWEAYILHLFHFYSASPVSVLERRASGTEGLVKVEPPLRRSVRNLDLSGVHPDQVL